MPLYTAMFYGEYCSSGNNNDISLFVVVQLIVVDISSRSEELFFLGFSLDTKYEDLS